MTFARCAPALAILCALGLLSCGAQSSAPAERCVELEARTSPEIGLLGPLPGPLDDLIARRSAELIAGPMVGYGTLREVAIWAETDGYADVRIRYWNPEAPDTVYVTAFTDTESSPDFTHLVRISHLDPGTTYQFEVLVDGEVVQRPYPLEFQTQALWRWRTEPPDFRMVIGSGTYINDLAYDRPGIPYGGGYEIFETVRETDPDVMVWLGDNVYLREADWGSREMMSYRYEHDRSLPELQPLLGAIHHYAIWDDHDFGPNDSDRSFEFRPEALELFRAYWANPTYGTPEAPGAYTRFVWSDVEFFLLDNRYYRAPNDAPDGPEKPHLGDEQLTWLLDGLTSSSATFKVVMVGGQVFNDISPYEGFHDYDHERQRLVDGIVERGIEGIVFVSGDRHHTELLQHEPDGFYPLVEITSSPLTSGPGDARFELENPARLGDTLIIGERNFVTLDFSGPRDDRVLTVTAILRTGEPAWQHQIARRELVVP